MNRSSKILRYVSRRLIQGIPIILAIVVLNFFLLNLAEGDAVDVLAGEAGSATPEYMEELRKSPTNPNKRKKLKDEYFKVSRKGS